MALRADEKMSLILSPLIEATQFAGAVDQVERLDLYG
jgi:hypothetical protein